MCVGWQQAVFPFFHDASTARVQHSVRPLQACVVFQRGHTPACLENGGQSQRACSVLPTPLNVQIWEPAGCARAGQGSLWLSCPLQLCFSSVARLGLWLSGRNIPWRPDGPVLSLGLVIFVGGCWGSGLVCPSTVDRVRPMTVQRLC